MKQQEMSQSQVAPAEMKKEKSSESIIASFLQKNESLVKTEQEESEQVVASVAAEDAEGAPEVIEIDAEKSAAAAEAEPKAPELVDQEVLVEEPEPVVREVAEAGTNMTISANEAALELQRINDQILEQTREELVAKEAKIKKMSEQMTMLEHALADKEQDLEEQSAEHDEKRSEDEAQWEKNRRELQDHVEELGAAIKEKVAAIEELEAQKLALQEGYEMRLVEKEGEIEAVQKEAEAIQAALRKDVNDLKALVKDQKASGDQQNKAH